jgi:class 3 adenylate cyclase
MNIETGLLNLQDSLLESGVTATSEANLDFLRLARHLRELADKQRRFFVLSNDDRALQESVLRELDALALRHRGLGFAELCRQSHHMSLPGTSSNTLGPAVPPTSREANPAPAAGAVGRDEVFISYSHKDRGWLERLQTMMQPLVARSKVKLWDDTRIKPGQNWKAELAHALKRAKVAVLLVSPDFLASEFIRNQELPALLRAAQSEGGTIFWIPLRPSLVEESGIADYQAPIDPARPLAILPRAEQQRSLAALCRQIAALVAPCGGGVASAPAEPRERIHFRSKVAAMDQSADRQRDFDAFVMSAKGETSTKNFQDWAGGEQVTLAIVFTDVVGSTALGEEIRDEAMNEVRRAHFAQSRRLIGKFQGREIKTIGDSFMAAFKCAGSALDYARALQGDTGHPQVQIRAGIHIGPMRVEAGDVFGGTVNFAARVVGAVKDAEIWLSDRAKEDIDRLGAAKHKGLKWERHEGVGMKGFPGKFTLWSLEK